MQKDSYRYFIKNMTDDKIPAHFKGKEAIDHVVEAQAQGLVSSTEMHGTELPGNLSAATDAARETVVLLLMLWLLFSQSPAFVPLNNPVNNRIVLLIIFSLGWIFWKAGRSAWLGWFRLERLHRIVDQERYEIEHHRNQERDELRILYATKGFEGKLLEEVLDVLMADNNRLLKVMVEEELGLTLGAYQHPLKQGLGAALGVLLTSTLLLSLAYFWHDIGIIVGSVITMIAASAYTAYLSKNRIIQATVWNLGLLALSVSAVYFSCQLYLSYIGD